MPSKTSAKVLPVLDEDGPTTPTEEYSMRDSVRHGFASANGSAFRWSKNGGGSVGLDRRRGSELGVAGMSSAFDNALERIRSVSQMRMTGKSSVTLSAPANISSPNMGSRNGALASYFYAPHPRPGSGVCFSPRGDMLLRFGYGPEFKLMKAINGSLANTLKGSPGNIRFAAFSTDGKSIMAASDDCLIFVFDVEAAMAGLSVMKAEIDVGSEAVAYCLMSPDGSTILSCDDEGQLETWSVSSRQMLKRYDTGHSAVMASFSSDGKMIISCADFECGLVLLDAKTAATIATETFDKLQEGRNKAGYCISADGRRVVVYIRDQTWSENLAIYDVDSQTYTVAMVCSGTLLDVQFSADGEELIASGRDNMIHVFDSETMDQISTLDGHSCDVMSCRVSGDRQYAISGDSDGLVFVWDIVHGTPILRLQAHSAPVVSCDISLDGTRAFTLDSEGHAHLWYLEMQGVLDVLQQSSDQVTCCQITADGRRMAVGYADGCVRLWLLGLTVSQIWQHSVHTCPIQCMSINPHTGAVATGSRDGTILLTSITGGQVMAALRGHKDVVSAISYCFDGTRMLSSCRDGSMCLWEPSSISGQMVPSPRPSPGHASSKRNHDVISNELRPTRVFQDEHESFDGIVCGVLNPKGTLAVGGGSSGSISMWDVASGAQIHKIPVSNLSVTSLEFRADGRHLVTGAADGSVSVVEVESGKVLHRLQGNASGIKATYFEHGGTIGKDLEDVSVVSVCSRQAVTWAMSDSSVTSKADFIADPSGDFFRNTTMPDRVFVAHCGLSIYDPLIKAAMYDMRQYETHPGNSAMFRDGTASLTGGVHHERLIMFSPPDKCVQMMVNETGGVKCLDFSPNGKLLVSGNLRGELSVWDVVHRQQLKTWMAHKRSAINCVKFSHDSTQVYSCGEDTKVILWSWTTASQAVALNGHLAPVVSVDMSLNGLYMVSGDKHGVVIIWDALKQESKQVLGLHDGAVLCVSISPDGSRVISSGKDEHVCVIDSETGDEVFNLDDALDGRGLTVKFSFDGTRLQLGSEKGDILIWSVQHDCLLYDIKAHQGNVYDCSWSGDSRRLLSVGTDGRARLWDAAAGSELCHANFEHGFGVVDSGGFIKCDLSADGTVMAGCTAKGHLILWDIGLELRKAPNGQMLYQWLASMPVSSAKKIYINLLERFPLLYNSQDSRGWTVLMHAASNCSPEIVKVIVGSIPPNQGCLGLMASALRSQPDLEDGRMGRNLSRATGSSRYSNLQSSEAIEEPNAIRIAIDASSGDCVHHLLNAVLDEKVTSGSYHCVTKALSDVAEQYPDLCEAFLSGLSLRSLGEIEIPSHIAAQGLIVIATTSYTSYKELWEGNLRLNTVEKGPMVVMEAVMVRLPFPAAIGSGSLLHTLGESRVPVRTFGSETVNAIITYKWRRFAQRQIYTKTVVYLVYLVLYTAYAICISDDPGGRQFVIPEEDDGSGNITYGNGTYIGVGNFIGLTEFHNGRVIIALSFITFCFGAYFMGLEGLQLVKLGMSEYFGSFWNFIDIFSYGASMVIPPCVLLRAQMNDQGFVYALVAVEAILLWAKSLFYGLAVDGLGTFIYMIIQIIKGLKFFYVLLFVLYMSFGVALLNLFRDPPSGSSQFTIMPYYDNIGNSMLTLYMSQLQNQDSREALTTMYPQIAIIVCCLYGFFANIIMINLIITLMSDLYTNIKMEQDLVFLRNRADLILEVESTMSASDVAKYKNVPPYLHLLKPIDLEGKREEAKKEVVATLSSTDRPDDGQLRQKHAGNRGRAADDDIGGMPSGLTFANGDLSRSPSMAGVGWTGQPSPSYIGRMSMKVPMDDKFGANAVRAMGRSHAPDRSLMTMESIRPGRPGAAPAAVGSDRTIMEMQAAMERQGKELAYLRRAMEVLLKHQVPSYSIPDDLQHSHGSAQSGPNIRRMASVQVRHGKGLSKPAGGRDMAALPTSPIRSSSGGHQLHPSFSPQGSSWDIDHAMSMVSAPSRQLRQSASGAVRDVARSESGNQRIEELRPATVFATSRVASFNPRQQLLTVPEGQDSSLRERESLQSTNSTGSGGLGNRESLKSTTSTGSGGPGPGEHVMPPSFTTIQGSDAGRPSFPEASEAALHAESESATPATQGSLSGQTEEVPALHHGDDMVYDIGSGPKDDLA